MDDSKSYNVNFFKPSTPFLRENIRAIVIGLVIWGVATYGFQILLKVIETPTPEASYVAYQQAESKLAQGNASDQEMITAANLYLAMLGKSAALLKNEDLKNAFTSTVYTLLPASEKKALLEAAAKAASDKSVDLGFVNSALGITGNKAMMAVVPYGLTTITPDKMAMTNAALKPVMDKFLIHNQSVLTDTIVLGFPFHYLYTALILLTLFVLICLVYCQVIDRLMKKYGMESSFE
jgi:putative solute:sodium symporter small subunit